jgi:hypothetical protein
VSKTSRSTLAYRKRSELSNPQTLIHALRLVLRTQSRSVKAPNASVRSPGLKSPRLKSLAQHPTTAQTTDVVSYLRGKHYIWSGSDGVHLWAADGEDSWKDSVWAESVKKWKLKRGQKPSGVRLPESTLDEFVVMRFAELIDEKKLGSTIRRVIKSKPGNIGEASLRLHAKELLRRLRTLKPKTRNK